MGPNLSKSSKINALFDPLGPSDRGEKLSNFVLAEVFLATATPFDDFRTRFLM